MNSKKTILQTIFFILALSIVAFFIARGKSYPGTFLVFDNTDKIESKLKADFSGATLVNLDTDSDQEVFIVGHGSANLFLKRSKDKFFPITIPELADPEGHSFSVTACDLDQDGRDEILIINRPDPTGRSMSRIVKFKEGKWIDLLASNDPIAKAIEFGYSSSCIDRKGNGQYGLAISNENGKMVFIENVDSKLTDIADEIGIALHSKGRSVLGVPGVAGHTNIFVGNEDGPNFYFINNGTGHFSENASAVGLADPFFNARGISIIDLNYDEIPDIVYGNNRGPTRLLEQTREGLFKNVAPEIMQEAYAVNSPVVGDFNLDGYEDLYLNNIQGNNKLFSKYGDDWFELDIGAMAEKELHGISSIAADLDKNGSYEILNTHGAGTSSPITLYSIKPVNKWIEISAKYKSGVIPRGAVVILKTNLRDQLRVISSGSGRFANYDSDVLFGLKKNESAISAEIILPSGIKFQHTKPLTPMGTNPITIPNPL